MRAAHKVVRGKALGRVKCWLGGKGRRATHSVLALRSVEPKEEALGVHILGGSLNAQGEARGVGQNCAIGVPVHLPAVC